LICKRKKYYKTVYFYYQYGRIALSNKQIDMEKNMSEVYFLVSGSLSKRVAGPFNTYEQAEERRQSYPNPRALRMQLAGSKTWKKCSDYANVGDLVFWKSSAGNQVGKVRFIDRDLPTGDPRKNADYYMVDTVDNKALYLNSNMMKRLSFQNLSEAA
jgi:hypothetical protein